MKLSDDSWRSWPETKTLLKAFHGASVRVVGGAVRDLILGIVVNDVDLATPLLPECVSELLENAGIKVIPTGIAHGTVTAVVGKRNFEITTLRRDVSTDGRRATVAYTDDWRKDASRRDFTMNALYCDERGEVIDFFGGIDDARQGRVRFIGNPVERIREDALRILRFFRFLAIYGKAPPDAQALAACAQQAAKIDGLSGERIQQEMLKLLAAPAAADVLALMQEQSILQYVIPARVAVDELRILPQLLQETKTGANPILSLALLVRSAGNSAALAERICARWKLSRAYARLLSDLCRSCLSVSGSSEREVKKQIRLAGRDMFILNTVVWLAEGGDRRAGLAAIALARNWQVPTFPVTGADLIEHGVKSGKEMGVLLKQLEQAWEEENYRPDKRQLLDKLEKRSKK